MKASLFVLGLLLPACGDLDLDLDSAGAAADVYHDGTGVRVRGCSDGVFLGCEAELPDATMTVTVDSAAYVSNDDPGEFDEVMSLFRTGTLRTVAPTPTDSLVGVELAGGVIEVALPPIFGIAAPEHVVRSAGPMRLEYGVIKVEHPEDGYSAAIVTSQCGRHTSMIDIPVPGELEIDLDRWAQPGRSCTHTIQINQATPANVVAAVGPGIAARTITIATVTVTSEP